MAEAFSFSNPDDGNDPRHPSPDDDSNPMNSNNNSALDDANYSRIEDKDVGHEDNDNNNDDAHNDKDNADGEPSESPITTNRQSTIRKRRSPTQKMIPLQCSTRNGMKPRRSKRAKRTIPRTADRENSTNDKKMQCLGNDLATMCRCECSDCTNIFEHHPKWVVAKNSKRIQGLGLFAKQPIPPDTFLMKYTGKEVSSVRKGKRYVIRLRNKFVDAEGQRGLHKYVNHCCDGDTYQRSARLHLWSDQNGIEHVSIVTNRQVEKGEELLVNYGSDYVIGDCRCPNCSNDHRQTRGTQHSSNETNQKRSKRNG